MAYDKVVDSAVLDGYFSDIADAIRDKGGSGTYTPAEMPQAIEDLPSGGNEALLALISGTATGTVTIKDVSSLNGAKIRICGFGSYSANETLEVLNMPDLIHARKNTSASSMDNSGGIFVEFTSSVSLREIHMPKCLTLSIFGNNALKQLETIDAPLLEAASINVQYSKITELDFPELIYANSSNFMSCTLLERVNLPKVTAGFNSGFRGCTALTEVNMPLMQNMQSNMFQDCTSLEEIILPSAAFQGSYNFTDCTSLDYIDVGGTGGMIGTGTFRNCPLTALVIRSTSMVTLSNTNAFQGTNIEAGTGYIYVPSALVSAYETATNWSTYAGQFRAIENYTSDGTLTGDFVMPT